MLPLCGLSVLTGLAAVVWAILASHTAHLLRRQLDAQTEQVTYWRTRAERLTDAALVRAHAIHQPTMVEPRPAPANTLNPLAAAMSALAIQEIDTRSS